jgi:hypothetical protein
MLAQCESRAIHEAMTEESLTVNLDRLEQALARAESLADRPMVAPNALKEQDFEALERKHRALRQRAISTIAELDSIIASADSGARN